MASTKLRMNGQGPADVPARGPAPRSIKAAPNTQLERSLAEIWQRLLRVAEIGIDDDFFDLGGHSLLGVELVYEIERALDRTCTLTMLFRNSTIRTLAAELHAGGPAATEPVVLELAGGGGPSVFCLSGVHVYQDLAEELAPTYSLYGMFLPMEQELFAEGGGRHALKALSVEYIASSYLASIREHQPSGPYMLLGLCFGGILGYEIAQQLRAAGEEVSLLVMLDATPDSAVPPHNEGLGRRLKEGVRRRCELLPTSMQRRLLGEEWVAEVSRLARARTRIYSHATRRYRVNPSPGPAVLIRPEASIDLSPEYSDSAWGWGPYISELETRDVPGNHATHLQRGNARMVAQALRPRLERAVAGRTRRA